jgi:hypothetical protein
MWIGTNNQSEGKPSLFCVFCLLTFGAPPSNVGGVNFNYTTPPAILSRVFCKKYFLFFFTKVLDIGGGVWYTNNVKREGQPNREKNLKKVEKTS